MCGRLGPPEEEEIVRIRTKAVVSLFAALALIGVSHGAQAADSPDLVDPGDTSVTRIGKVTPEMARQADAEVAKLPRMASNWPIICFQAHVRNHGDTAVRCSNTGGWTGLTGENEPIEAAEFWYYSVADRAGMAMAITPHFADFGTGGEKAMPVYPYSVIVGYKNTAWHPLQALRLRSTTHNTHGAAHVQNVGWKGFGPAMDQWIGSIGENRWMEAFYVSV